MSYRTFILVRALVWGMRIVIGSMCLDSPSAGLLALFSSSTTSSFIFGIVDLVFLVFLNLKKPYHAYLYVSLCESHVK